MMIERAALASLVPHAGAMMLLDGVEFWDGQRIICISMQHRANGNPLLTKTGLSSLNGIEFAAQAMAAHGALTDNSSGRPRSGLLLSVRDCRLHVRRLDDLASPLRIEAMQLGRTAETRIYRFELSAREVKLVDGRLTVQLRQEEAP
ncbi:MAG: hydroxymyristoyl-ACP dehydratase [Betaproteobacteria bacterium]